MSFKQKETFEKLTLEEIEVENKNKIEKIKFSIEKSQKDMETLKIQKEKYLTFIETYFQNMETQLNSQIETLNFNIDVLEKKEAKNLEEILQISKQIEWIYSNENRDVILNVSKENLESIVKKSIKLVEGFKVPVEVYTKIDFLRHCNWEKVFRFVKNMRSTTIFSSRFGKQKQ
jgi:phage-related protein